MRCRAEIKNKSLATWHHTDLTVAAGAPDTSGNPVGYVFAAQGTQHVIYQGVEPSFRHIHELWWDTNGWHHTDLTVAAGDAPTTGTDPSGYVFNAQGTQHVIYIGGDVDELWWDTNGWHHNDLSVAAGAPPFSFSSGPVGYAFNAQRTQHVVYVDADELEIHELRWDTNGWHHNNLTDAAGGPLISREFGQTAPHGYVFDAQGTQHVVYTDADSQAIHELWWDTNGWHYNNLTIASGAPSSAGSAANPSCGDPVGYVFDAQGTQHVVYVGPSGQPHVHELWWDTSGWHHTDLTVAAHAPDPAALTVPAGYVFDAQGTQHVVYVAPPGDVHELWWDTNGWHNTDLTVAAHAPPGQGTASGYVFDAQGTQHVIYGGADNHVHELWWG